MIPMRGSGHLERDQPGPTRTNQVKYDKKKKVKEKRWVDEELMKVTAKER